LITSIPGWNGKLVEELANKVSEAGGEILTDTSVISVDSQAHEVVLSDGQKAGYKKLVWAADQNSLYQIVSGTSDSKVQKQRALNRGLAKGSEFQFTRFS